MHVHVDETPSWGHVGLAILPGIFALAVEIGLWQRLFPIDTMPGWGEGTSALLLFCALLCLVGFLREGRFPAWSFSALGIVLAHLSMGVMASPALLIVWVGIVAVAIGAWREHQGLVLRWERWLLGLILAGSALYVGMVPYTSSSPAPYPQALSAFMMVVAVLALFSVLPAMVGLVLALRVGVLAGLVVVGSAFVIWESIGDPEYALLLWTDNQVLERVLSIHPQLFFLIIVPILVLRLRSFRSRIAAFLLPISVAFVSAAAIGSVVRPYISFFSNITFDSLFILLPLAVLLVIYANGDRDLSHQPGFTDI